MHLVISFWEIFPENSWVSGGWVGEIPDGSGRGIRHYNEFEFNGESFITPEDNDQKIIPNFGYIQIENESINVWQEYDITCDNDKFITVSMQDTFSIKIVLKEITYDEYNPHKYIDETEYNHIVQNILIISR